MLSEVITLTTLDGLALPRVDFLKVDVEVEDGGVLAGGQRTIEHSRPVIPVRAGAGNAWNACRRFGRRLFRLLRPARVPLLHCGLRASAKRSACIQSDYGKPLLNLRSHSRRSARRRDRPHLLPARRRRQAPGSKRPIRLSDDEGVRNSDRPADAVVRLHFQQRGSGCGRELENDRLRQRVNPHRVERQWPIWLYSVVIARNSRPGRSGFEKMRSRQGIKSAEHRRD